MPDTHLATHAQPSGDALRQALSTRFQKIRARTAELAAPCRPRT
ncbi:hypothetical protein [Azospirillum formosense]|nr:hypothetical protein [Azospirillum formosense]